MATRVCPTCNAQYVASVRRCITCDVMLVDEVRDGGEAPATSAASPVGGGDFVAYELAGWGNQLKVTLAGMLDRASIPGVWEASALVVPAADEAEVDNLIATLEGDDVVELETEAVQIAFALDGVSSDEMSDLDARLIAAQVAHAWDDSGELLVAEDDEDVVAEIIDDVLNGEPDDDGSPVTLEALSGLFVATDKLLKDPADRKLSTRFVAASEGLADLGVPYGMAGGDWKALVAQVEDLRSLVDGGLEPFDDDEESDWDTPTERARALTERLRDRLRELV